MSKRDGLTERQSDKLEELQNILLAIRGCVDDTLVRGWIDERTTLRSIDPLLESAIRRVREMSS